VSKSLVITEKPSVARDIMGALGGFREHEGYWESDRYVVTFSVGHIVELLEPEDLDPAYKRWTLDILPIIPQEFKLKPKSGMSDRIRTIKKLLKRDDISEVVNACDAGREGELIFREIMDFLQSDKPTRRLWLQSMTRDSIRNGFSSLEPGEQYDGLASAAACRSQSDWLIGMNATRALTKRLRGRRERGAWSAGRVQTPTLAILVGRELEILGHVARPFWRIEARFDTGSHEYVATWFDPGFRAGETKDDRADDRIFEEQRAREIADAVREQASVARETRKASKETAPPLFDLTSLQRECNRRFGWSARRTLNAAQRCYEGHKVLTYPRTDSRCLPSDYRGKVDELVTSFAAAGPYQEWAQRLLDDGLQNTGRTFNDAGVTDHFAIIPTGSLPREPLTGDDGRLFDLVTRRTLGSFYPPAVWNRVERITEVEGHSFRSRARTLVDPGWRSVMGQTEQEDQALPHLVPGEDTAEGVAVQNRSVEVQEDQTKPPPRVTEARILSLMENAGRAVDDEQLAQALHEKGIGTPATRADIIENLIRKGYVVRQGKALRPTVKGIRLVDILRRMHADRLASPELTGDMEYRLREVERGTRTAREFMKEMAEYTTHVVDRARDFDYDDLYPDEEPLGTCPCEHKRPVYERSWFYRCKEDPDTPAEEDCEFRLWKDKAGRYMDRATVELLLEKRETPPLDGFLTRDGRGYGGSLKLEGKDLKLTPLSDGEGERTSDQPEYEVNDAPIGSCPACTKGQIVETPTHYRCSLGAEKEGEKPCPFVLPRTVCRREITREEAESYVRDSRTAMLEEFISRYGRPFSAVLFLKPNGRHGFEFAPRPARKKGAGGSPSRKRPARGSGRKKGTGKKAARKKTTRKEGAGKKAARKRPATSRKKGATKRAPSSATRRRKTEGD
jgi:DNA topoisomerase-3